MGTKHYLVQMFSEGMDDFVMDEKTLKTMISEVSHKDHVGEFFQLTRRNPQRIHSRGWNYQCSVLQRFTERLLNRIWCVRLGMCECGDRFFLHNNAPFHNATRVKQFLAQRKVTVLGHPPLFARFSTCWLLFVPKSEIPLERAPLTWFRTSRQPWQVH